VEEGKRAGVKQGGGSCWELIASQLRERKIVTYDSVAPGVASLVTMGFKSPFLLFLPAPLPLAAEAATLAICFPLFKTLVRSTPSMFVECKMRRGNEVCGPVLSWCEW
jgi:hypothetical protein